MAAGQDLSWIEQQQAYQQLPQQQQPCSHSNIDDNSSHQLQLGKFHQLSHSSLDSLFQVQLWWLMRSFTWLYCCLDKLQRLKETDQDKLNEI